MPVYFYKASECQDRYGTMDDDWFEAFEFTIADLITGCRGNIVILPVLLAPNEIEKHTEPKLKFEYRRYGPISSDRINFTRISRSFSENGDIDQDTYMPYTDVANRGRDKLKDFIERCFRVYGRYRDDDDDDDDDDVDLQDYTNFLYFHITCEKNVGIIQQRGLIDVDNNHTDIVIQRIGDRGDGEENGNQMDLDPLDPDLDLFSGGKMKRKMKRKSAFAKSRKKTSKKTKKRKPVFTKRRKTRK
jgi:hypothetical protein